METERQTTIERKKKPMKKKNNKMITFAKTVGGAVAAALIAITVMANSGASIAHAMAKIPVIGAIAEVVTFREYQDSTNQMYADVKVPEVEVKMKTAPSIRKAPTPSTRASRNTPTRSLPSIRQTWRPQMARDIRQWIWIIR